MKKRDCLASPEEEDVPGTKCKRATSEEWSSYAKDTGTKASQKRDGALGECHEGAIDTESSTLFAWANAFADEGSHIGHSETIGDSQEWDNAINPNKRGDKGIERDSHCHHDDGKAENLTFLVAMTNDTKDKGLSDDNPKTHSAKKSANSGFRKTKASYQENTDKRGKEGKARNIKKACDIDWAGVVVTPSSLDVVDTFPDVKVFFGFAVEVSFI